MFLLVTPKETGCLITPLATEAAFALSPNQADSAYTQGLCGNCP